MERFHNILFVSQGITDETEALKQAFNIAFQNKAKLKALIYCPEFPEEMINYREKYENSLIQQLETSIQVARDAIKRRQVDLPIEIQVVSGSMPAVHIVRCVLKNKHDLVIKEVEPKEGAKGFKAVDMELLRKCPCPVLLCRAISKPRAKMKIAVAVDPESKTPEGYDLSLHLLALSRSLADTCDGELHIISCWDYELEQYLHRNVWINLQKEEVTRIVNGVQNKHHLILENVIQKSGISGKIALHHLRGPAEQAIPEVVKEKNIDILVMGTVGRTGISGFVIGNTAENIAQKLPCSLLALKPNGFISPIKAYE